jgi:hypothetical protein
MDGCSVGRSTTKSQAPSHDVSVLHDAPPTRDKARQAILPQQGRVTIHRRVLLLLLLLPLQGAPVLSQGAVDPLVRQRRKERRLPRIQRPLRVNRGFGSALIKS